MKSSYFLANLFLLLALCLQTTKLDSSWPLILFTLTTLSFFFLLDHWLVPGGLAWRGHDHSLPGPMGWPVVGSLTQMGPLAHRRLAALARSMGAERLMAMSLGATRVVISSHPETARQILCSPAFSSRPIKSSARALMFERAIGFAPSGVYWRRLRRMAATHMFSPRQISRLEELRHRVFDEMAENVQKAATESRALELRGIVRRGSLRNMLESVFGSEGLGVLRVEELGLMVQEGYELISEFSLEDHFALGFFDFWGLKRRCHKLATKVNLVIGKIVVDRKRDSGFSSRNDYLSVFLSLPEKEKLSDQDLIAVLWETVFRGTDTVTVLVEWIMARMVIHQEAQKKAQEELVTCIGKDSHVRDSDLPNLPYLRAIVKEVLRLHPPGPLLSWARLATEDVYVDKVKIPAGTTAMVNMWAIAHDSTIWKDPFEFRPERFMDEEVSVMGSDLRLAPFGAGRRVCPGRAMGLATVELWVARLLHQFKWFPISDGGKLQPVDLSEHLKLSMEMRSPLTCCVTPLYEQ